MQHLALLARFAGDAEVGHHEIEKLRDAEPGIEDEGGGNAFLVQPLEQLVDQRGFSGSHLAGQQDEALAGLNSVGQAGQRFLRVMRQEKIARVRIDVERIFFESEELLIHATIPQRTACTTCDSLEFLLRAL